jgi:nucleotide-binding universal stress UspA family protein
MAPEPALAEASAMATPAVLPYERILVPLDGSETSTRGLHEAIRLASGQKTRLVLLFLIDGLPTLDEVASPLAVEQTNATRHRQAEAFIAECKATAALQHVECDTAVADAFEPIATTIMDIAAKTGCGLIVMGTHGRSGLSRLALGSVAERVARQSRVPVLMVPPGARAT